MKSHGTLIKSTHWLCMLQILCSCSSIIIDIIIIQFLLIISRVKLRFSCRFYYLLSLSFLNIPTKTSYGCFLTIYDIIVMMIQFHLIISERLSATKFRHWTHITTKFISLNLLYLHIINPICLISSQISVLKGHLRFCFFTLDFICILLHFIIFISILLRVWKIIISCL